MKFWAIRLGSIAIAVAASFMVHKWATGSGSELLVRLTFLTALYITLSVSLNLINGITGQFSIGHAAFYMVGAYVSGSLTNTLLKGASMPDPLKMLILMIAGAAGSAVAGIIVGLPSLRLRGDYLAIVTLGFGEILRIIAQNTEAIGGSYGMNVKEKFKLVWMVWLLAILCIAVCRNLLKTAHGLPFLSVREDEIASSAMGVHVTKVKVIAFVIGSAFAGAAGAMYANFDGFVSPTTFPMELSFTILTMVVLGGTGSITGSAFAGAVLYLLPEKLRDLPPVSGASLLASVIAVVAAVYAIKRITDHFHGEKLHKAGLYVASIVGLVVVEIVLAMIFKNVKPLADASFEASKLRMVMFAGTLIILMLIRPQGILAHHEFSWSLFKRGDKGKPAVAA